MAKRRRRRSEETNEFSSSPTFSQFSRELLSPVHLPADPLTHHLETFRQDAIPYDRREFTFGEPEPYTLGVVNEADHNPVSTFATVPAGVAFNDSRTVAICVRRKERREVLFATRRTGRGSNRNIRHRNEWSKIKC